MRKKKQSRDQGDGDDTEISRQILIQANRAVLRQVRVNRRFDVPYVAGYSENGKTIYLDRDLPKTFKANGKRIDVEPFVVLHESVEKALVEQLKLIYQHAHQLAQRIERSAIEDAGVPWSKYQAFIQKHLKDASENRDLRIPPDLDLEPYRDEEDYALLRKMRRTSGKSS